MDEESKKEETVEVEEDFEAVGKEFSLQELEVFAKISELWEKILRGEVEPEAIKSILSTKRVKITRKKRRRTRGKS